MPVDAVVFDLDDTLVDWRTSVHRTATETCGEAVAEDLLSWAQEHTWPRRDGIVVARDTWKMVELAEQTWPSALPDLDPDELALAMKRFRAELWISFFPDTVPVLDELVDEYRLALLSNNPYLQREVRRLRLGDWFELAITLPRDEVKPDRRAFNRVLEALGTEPARTAFVGDSIAADVEGAMAAGLLPIWLDRHADGWLVPSGVHHITSLVELPALLGRL